MKCRNFRMYAPYFQFKCSIYIFRGSYLFIYIIITMDSSVASNKTSKSIETKSPHHSSPLDNVKGFKATQVGSSQSQKMTLSNNENSRAISESQYELNIGGDISNNKQLTQFLNAWKTECGLGVLLMEKLSIIVTNYFKMIPQIKRRNEEIEILVQYNTNLLEILSTFEQQEKRILNKLKTMQQFNIRIMKQLCHMKNKPFKPIEIKGEEGIFQKFSLSDYKFDHSDNKNRSYKFLEKQRDVLIRLFKEHLLPEQEKLRKKIEKVITNQSSSSSVQRNSHLLLYKKIEHYNLQRKQANLENFFQLYQMKIAILQQGKDLFPQIQIQEQKSDIQQKSFVKEVLRIYAGISNLQQVQTLVYVKSFKQINRKLRKLRLRQQQKFIRSYEQAYNENQYLKKDQMQLKQKNTNLQKEINRIRAENDIKKMKNNKQSNNKSGLMQDSIVIDDRQSNSVSKKILKETHKTMTYDLKKLKQQNERLQEVVAEYKSKQTSKSLIFPKIRQRIQKIEPNYESNWDQLKIIEAIIAKYGELENERAQDKIKMAHLEQQNLASPQLEGHYEFENGNYIKQSHQQTDILLNRIKQLQLQNNDMKKIHQQLTAKHTQFKVLMQQREAKLKLQNSKINQLVKQYHTYQFQIKQYEALNQLLVSKCQVYERVIANFRLGVKQLDIAANDPSFFKDNTKADRKLKQIVGKLQPNLDSITIEISKKQQNYHQKQLLHKIIGKDQKDDSMNSYKSFNLSKEKRQEDNMSLKLQQYRNSIAKNLKNRSLDQDNFMQSMLEKSLGVKKIPINSLSKIPSQKEKKADKNGSPKSRQEQNVQIVRSINKLYIQNKSSSSSSKKKISQKLPEFPGYEKQGVESDECKIDSHLNKNSFSNNKSSEPSYSNNQCNISNNMNSSNSNNMNKKNQNGFEEHLKNEGEQKKNKVSLTNLKRSENLDGVNKKRKSSSNEEDKIVQFPQSPSRYKQTRIKERMSLREKQDTDVMINNKINQSNLDGKIGRSFKQQYKQEKNDKQVRRQERGQPTLDRKESQRESSSIKNLELVSNLGKKMEIGESEVKNNPMSKRKKRQEQRSKEGGDESNDVMRISSDSRQKKKGLNNLDISKISQNNQSNISTFTYDQRIIRILNVTNNSEQDSRAKQRQKVQEYKYAKEKKKVNNIVQIPTLQHERNSQMENISLNYSKDAHSQKNRISREQSNRFGQRLTRTENEGNMQYSINNLPNRSNLQQQEQFNILSELQYKQIKNKINKLANLDDISDFNYLYQRYKQVLLCLEQSQILNKTYEIKYRRFLKYLQDKQSENKDYSLEQKIFYLENFVEQLQLKLKQYEQKYEGIMKKSIVETEKLIGEQLRILRSNNSLMSNTSKRSGKKA